MGDFRCSAEIKAVFWGHEYKADMWINWFADETGCDERIYKWFAECARDARVKYELEDMDYQAQKRAEKNAALEAKERAELTRLLEKYGSVSDA